MWFISICTLTKVFPVILDDVILIVNPSKKSSSIKKMVNKVIIFKVILQMLDPEW